MFSVLAYFYFLFSVLETLFCVLIGNIYGKIHVSSSFIDINKYVISRKIGALRALTYFKRYKHISASGIASIHLTINV